MKRIVVYIFVFLTIGNICFSFESEMDNETPSPYFEIKEYDSNSKSKIYLSQIPTQLNFAILTNVKQQSRCDFGYHNIQPIYMGPTFGYSGNYLTDIIKSSTNLSVPNNDLLQSGNGYNIGLSYEEMLGEITESYQSLIFNLNYNGFGISSEKSFINSASNNKMLDLTGRESDSSTTSMNYKNEVSFSSINFDVLYKLNFIPGVALGVVLGPSFDFSMKHDLKETLSLDNTDQTLKFKKQDGIILDESGRTGTLFNDKIQDYSTFQLIIKAGIQYEIILPTRMYITPYFIYGYNVTNLIKNSDIKLSNLNFGFAIRFPL